MTAHNSPFIGLLFYALLIAIVCFFIFSCVTLRKPEEVLCLNPCEVGNVVYVEAIAGKDLYVIVMNIRGFDPAEEVIAYQIFELHKEKLTKALGYAICYTASIEIESLYQTRVAAQDLFVVKGVIACQD